MDRVIAMLILLAVLLVSSFLTNVTISPPILKCVCVCMCVVGSTGYSAILSHITHYSFSFNVIKILYSGRFFVFAGVLCRSTNFMHLLVVACLHAIFVYCLRRKRGPSCTGV